MNYHLSDHIYVTQFRDELILLDAKKDKYTICFKDFSELMLWTLGITSPPSKVDLRKSFKNNARALPESFSQFPAESTSQINLSKVSAKKPAIIQNLLDDGILEQKESPYPFYIDQKPHSEGVSNVDWRLPLENKKVRINHHVLSALWTLIKVNNYIKFKGFYPTIQLIQRSKDPQTTYIIPSDEELRDLANIVNKACLLYPSRTKCLEWAITFVLMALKRKWKCNLEIGVQNYPFFAHAWVECDGKVVMDSSDLRTGLGIILNEPFRRTI